VILQKKEVLSIMGEKKKKLLFQGVTALLLLSGGLWGCASHDVRSNYEKLLEKQMEMEMANARTEKLAPNKLPKMTDREHERLGDAHFRREKFGRAYVQYDKARRLNPKNVRIRYKIGLLFLAKGLSKEAIAEFQEVLKEEPRNALAYEGMGLAMLQSGQPEAAKRRFLQALALDPNLWKAHTFLGIIYNSQNLPEAALREHKTAILLEPKKEILHNNLGISYALMGEHDNALRAFDKALESKTSHDKIYNNLGLVLSRLRRYEEALEAFKKGGSEAQAYNNLGCVYLQQGDYDKAIRSFEKAMELSPRFYARANDNLEKARSLFLSKAPLDVDVPHESGAALSTERVGEGNRSTSRTGGIPDKKESETRRFLPKRQKPEQTKERAIWDNVKDPANSVAQSDKSLRIPPDLTELATARATPPPLVAERSDPETRPRIPTLGAGMTPGTERFTIQVATFRQRKKANLYLEELKKAGFKAFRWETYLPETGKWHQVCVGDFTTVMEARLLAKDLEQKGFKATVAELPGTRTQTQSN
jgi:Tfp pilus assembly protein PilF/cell division septation protein DedD